MSRELVVNSNGSLGFQEVDIFGTISITDSPSDKVKAEGFGVYKGDALADVVNFNITGAVQGDCAQAGTFNDFFSPSVLKNKVEGKKPLRENDSKSVSIPGVKPDTTACIINGTVVVSSPGQSTVKAE